MLTTFAASIVAMIMYMVGIIILAFVAGMCAFLIGCIRMKGRIDREVENERSCFDDQMHGASGKEADRSRGAAD